MAYSKIILNGETLMDVTSDTVDAGNLLSGKTATKNSGAKVTGEFPDSPVFTINWNGTTWDYTVTCNKTYSECLTLYQDENYISRNRAIIEDYVDGSFNVSMGGTAFLDGTTLIYTFYTGGLDALYEIRYNSNNTLEFSQDPSTVLHGEFSAPGYYSPGAYKAFKTVNINIPSKSSSNTTFTSSTGTFTAPSGYYSTNATRTITTQAAQTFYPSTADQTIASYKWLTGSQTIKSVTTTNLTAANIAEGVVVKVGDANNASRISQITGTYAPTTSSLTVTPMSTTQTFNATGVYGYKPVTVNGDSNLIPENIADGVSIFGVSGTHSGSDLPQTYRVYLQNLSTNSVALRYESNIYSNTGYYSFPVGQPIEIVNNSSSTYKFACFYDTFDDVITLSQSEALTVYMGPEDLTVSVYSPYISITASMAYYTNVWQDVLYTRYFERNVIFTIPERITNLGQYAFALTTNLKDIKGPNITTMDAYAFYGCYSLVTASFPNVLGIPASCFMNCSKLTTISAPKCKVIYANAFNHCGSIYSINMPLVERVNTSAFCYCSSKLSTINFSYCSYVGSEAFAYCYSLSTVYLPKCTSFGSSVFRNCIRLISLYLNEVSSVPSFGSGMFYSTPFTGNSSYAGQYGSIFVPSSLYADFITASGWSPYSSYMVSV